PRISSVIERAFRISRGPSSRKVQKLDEDSSRVKECDLFLDPMQGALCQRSTPTNVLRRTHGNARRKFTVLLRLKAILYSDLSGTTKPRRNRAEGGTTAADHRNWLSSADGP